jgi:hypothetical protein
MTITSLTLIVIALVVLFYVFIRLRNKNWKDEIEEDTEREINNIKDLNEEVLVGKISFRLLKDNYPIYVVLQAKGTIIGLNMLIDLYNKHELNNDVYLNKYHFLKTIDVIASKNNIELPVDIKNAVKSNTPTK